jgi:D-glycero-D-manno-heptose 1,7-bisphosphate phosphatase
MNKAAFLDRDGVINRKAEEGQYVTRWEEMSFLPGSSEAIRLFNRAGFLVVVVSNQRCVAKGLVTSNEVDSLHARMRGAFEAAGATIDAIYYCPHEARPACSCRKPRPGMLLQAARTFDIDLAASWMIGDSESDVEAGRTAGCSTARLMAMAVAHTAAGTADIVAGSLFDATHKILQMQPALTFAPAPLETQYQRTFAIAAA